MTKKVLLLLLFVFVLFSNQAFAHTSLEDSTPKDGEVITEPIQELTLLFETKVEETSSINVLNSNGESVTLGNFVIEDGEMWANFLQPLENGDYKVEWKIIGADGHPIDGEFSFSVNVPITEGPAEEQIEPQEETQSQPNVEEKEVDTVTEAKDEEIPQNKMPSYVIPSIIGVLIVIVVVSFLLIMKRKK
jgi:copper resistance protein C